MKYTHTQVDEMCRKVPARWGQGGGVVSLIGTIGIIGWMIIGGTVVVATGGLTGGGTVVVITGGT